MKISGRDIKNKIINGDMTRREFATSLAAIGLTTAMMPMMPGKAQAAADVNYFTWSGYEDETFFQKFVEKHGDLPAFSYFASEDEGLAKVRAGYKPSFGHPCSDTFPRWVRAGVTEGFDKSRLEHWGDVWPRLTGLDGQYDANGGVLFAPFDFGNSSVVFNADAVDPKYVEEHTWEILWDERYAGRISMYNAHGGASAVAGLALGMNHQDIWAPSDDQIAKIQDKLRQLQTGVRFWWDDRTTMEQGMASGELVAAYAWNETPLKLKADGMNVVYMTPKEGILFWVCGLTKFNSEYGSGDEGMIYDVVNEMMSPEVGQYLVEEWGYGHGNMKAWDHADPATVKENGLDDLATLMDAGVFFQDIPDEINQKLSNMLEEVQAGL